MKHINKIFLLAIIAFLGNSCSDLEEDTSSLLTVGKIETEADIAASVAPIYRRLLEMHKTPHFTRTATYGGDDITTWIAGNKAPLRVFDRYDYGSGENSDINWLPHAWDGYWQTIYYCNTLIDGLKTATAPESVVKVADAEARTFRALSYLNLVKLHGNMPLILDGVLPTGEEQRATVLENYLQIESDLLIAETSLPIPGTQEEGRASASLAKSILADLYLTWAGWPVKDVSKYPLAAEKAKDVIDYNYHTLLPIDQLWLLEGADSKESIFSLRYSDDESIVGQAATAFTFHQGRGFSDCFPELQFFNDFPEGPRKDATFILDIPNRNSPGGVITPKDPPTIPWPDSDRGHPMYKKYVLSEDLTFGARPVSFRSIELYRYAEILLIYAEAQARGDGENTSSIEALNQVKRRAAGLPYLSPDGSVDVASATPNEIVDEKGWELAAENKRWFDLVRTERVAEMAAKRDASEPVTLVRQPGEAQYIAPIPFNSISLSDLVQNPEGFKIQ
ncbi:RagB/SusD family nutrient uptake outer membrane protein [Flavivirga abyssicola]|uniref:RagB/SusD family nutrient uptake outer membrane protein n=1 Tax=Flavivirga abyssicola TaxID=3063533 RepID=UPI0026E09E7D|nr:RagB/SusD family nutrient uptake outer membrane protein [Flavivirga sp. MEBiC07777]WVK12649.1 RagB/SusD family nutrient uptake outer membrane protein [Flavivirga sp. MEBiC07777]